MQKFFTLSLLILATFTLQAQVVFQQDFENGIAPMTLVNNDGKTPAAAVAAYSAAWTAANPTFGNGTMVAVSNSWYSPPGAADDWMITPAITITGATTILAWEAKAQDASFPDGYQVRISKTGTALADFTEVAFNIANEMPDWQQRGVSLAAYVGETIHIAFRNNSNDQFLLLVDNILVANILDRDVAVRALTTTQFHLAGADVAVEVEIANEGGQVLDSVDLAWSDGTNTYSETITGLNLAYGESKVVTSATTFNIAEAKSYNLTVTASNPNGDVDGFLDNNSVDGVVSGVSYIPTKKMVAEEGTGTWCQFCPRGTDWMDYMAKTYPDQFIGVAVHNGSNDPMVLTEYDNSVPFNAYPTAMIDRAILDIDPSDLEDLMDLSLEKIAPVAPEIEASLDVATMSLEADASVEFVTQLDNVNYRLGVILSEDGVHGTSSGYAQVNAYAGGTDPLAGYGYNWHQLPQTVPGAQLEYDHVGRALLGGYNGMANSIPASVVAGDKASNTFTVNNFNKNWNPFNMHAIVVVINNATGAILNSNSTQIDVTCPADFAVTVNTIADTTGTAGTGSIISSVANPNFGFGGYTFTLDNGSTGSTITGLPAGDYSLVVSDKIGCTQTIDVTVGSVTGVNDIESLATISLTPNPASSASVLNARFDKLVDARVVVINSVGKVVENVKYDGSTNFQHNFDLSGYPNGIYLVKLSVGNQIHTERMIIAK